MKRIPINAYKFLPGIIAISLCIGFISYQEKDARFLSYTVDPKTADIAFYWKDTDGKIFRNFNALKQFIEHNGRALEFAMNGGMYLKDNSPQGLFIENGAAYSPLDTLSGVGNFYMKPNGVFYLTKNNEAIVCNTTDFTDHGQVKFATQSGPMLLINGKIHPAFKEGSKNLNIRNGVGILPDGKVIFAMSKEEVNFYDFAMFFKKMNCANALYLDGFVSRTYLPKENWKQLDGNFGVIIGVVK
jgi:uncharacterized protein YigE (DUF2233 family)